MGASPVIGKSVEAWQPSAAGGRTVTFPCMTLGQPSVDKHHAANVVFDDVDHPGVFADGDVLLLRRPPRSLLVISYRDVIVVENSRLGMSAFLGSRELLAGAVKINMIGQEILNDHG